jgi:hypothetical protein
VITDITPYRKHVDQFDLTEEQKVELVNAVTMIVESIFDHHFSVKQLKQKEKIPQKNIDCTVQYSKIGKAKNASKTRRVNEAAGA